MEREENFSELVGGIYDAALDPLLWPDAVSGAARFVGGPGGALLSKDAATKSGETRFDGYVDPQQRRIYFEQYVGLDPTMIGQTLAPICQPMATADSIPYPDYLKTRFYNEWARPLKVVDAVTAVLDRSASSAALFVVFRTEREGVVDHQTKARMQLVSPHIRRATLVSRAMDLGKAEAATLADTLDGIGAGVFLVDANGRLLHANAAGRTMIAAGDSLRVASGGLTSSDAHADEALRRTFCAAGVGDDTVGVQGVSIPLTGRSGERHVAHVLPLGGGERRRAGAAYKAACALFVRKAALESPSRPGTIAKAFSLTPTELRVLLTLVEVGGAPEVAETLGVAESTVKTHLGRLYGKTGACRQADLVKLVAGFQSPLLH